MKYRGTGRERDRDELDARDERRRGNPRSRRSDSPSSDSEGDEQTSPRDPATIRRGAITWLARLFLMFAVAAGSMLVLTIILILQNPRQSLAIVPTLEQRTRLPARTPTITPTPEPPPVALVAGHSGGADPGAVCPDGLREVDVTTEVAQRAKSILQARGYRVEILEEFDSRLASARGVYSPRVFLSLHADSCVYYASGYKVARAANSGSPEQDDRLVRCVSAAYAAATSLPLHAGSITIDMTQYHGLFKISPQTPAAIIELGFLGSDYDLLKNRRRVVADGVANGLDEFLRGNQCK